MTHAVRAALAAALALRREGGATTAALCVGDTWRRTRPAAHARAPAGLPRWIVRGEFRSRAPTSLLAVRDTLALTDAQVASLTTVRDTLAARAERLARAAAEEVRRAAQSLDPTSTLASPRPRIQEGRAFVQEALAAAERVLTPERWARVPTHVKQPLRRLDQMTDPPRPGRP